MDLSNIKPFLRLAGITNLSVRFDCHKQQVEATYTKAGQRQATLIRFQDIEDQLTEGPSQAVAGPPPEENRSTGRI